MIRTFRTPEINCPSCGTNIDAVSNPIDLADPNPGDVSVCIYCGAFLEFGSGWTLHKLPDATLLHIKKTDPDAYYTLLAIHVSVISKKK